MSGPQHRCAEYDPTCWRCDLSRDEMTAPRPESGGQQQAAAEVWLDRLEDVASRLPVTSLLAAIRAGFVLADDLDREGREVDWLVSRAGTAARLRGALAAALTEAARPGQELRERVRELADELEGDYEIYADEVARRLRAALEDPR